MFQTGYTCNKCGKDYSRHQDRNDLTKKVIVMNFANVLCCGCETEMKSKIRSIVIEYLDEK